MSKIAIAPEDWFDKQFRFEYPIGAFPALIERLRGTPARLEELVRALPPAILTTRLGDDWSIQEQVGHLYDLEELHDGRLDDYDAGLPMLRAADLTNSKTYAADHNSAVLADLLAVFRATRRRFVARLEEMDEAAVSRSAIHPRLQQPMRVVDLANFSAEHDDHHLASIVYLARTLGGA